MSWISPKLTKSDIIHSILCIMQSGEEILLFFKTCKIPFDDLCCLPAYIFERIEGSDPDNHSCSMSLGWENLVSRSKLEANTRNKTLCSCIRCREPCINRTAVSEPANTRFDGCWMVFLYISCRHKTKNRNPYQHVPCSAIAVHWSQVLVWYGRFWL